MTKGKFMTADEAIQLVKSGDSIYIQGSTSIPETLSDALARRLYEINDVIIYNAFAVASRPAPYCVP